MLGTDVREITVTDLAVHPKTRNAFASVMRGRGTNAQPALEQVAPGHLAACIRAPVEQAVELAA